LLKDREAETLRAWLAAHPRVEIISQDRAYTYAEASRKGAPDAVQIAGRFHLLKNLSEAFDNFLKRFIRISRRPPNGFFLFRFLHKMKSSQSNHPIRSWNMSVATNAMKKSGNCVGKAVIPPRANRREQREYDKHLYKERHLVECFINKIKHYGRVFSRFEKLAKNFLGFLSFVSALIWLR
jgi:Transposase